MKAERLAIIGGGPIGLGLSLFLAKRGYRVDLYEQGRYPRDKACGQGIMPKGQSLLYKDLGIDLQKYSHSFTGIDYIDQDVFLQGQLKNPGIGVERRILSNALFEKVSKNAFINVFAQTKVDDLEFINDHILLTCNSHLKEYRYAFACDGINSALCKKFDMQHERSHPWRQGARVHFNQAPWSDHVQVYWNDGIEAYVTPVAKDRIEIAFLWYEDTFSKNPPPLKGKLLNQLFSFFPMLESKVNFSLIDSDFKGSAMFSHVAKTSHYKRLFFVGDSYGFLDGITGEGISLGLDQAKYVASHFDRWSFINTGLYRLKYMHYWMMIHLALSFSRHLKWRRFLLKRLNSKVFSWILKLNDI